METKDRIRKFREKKGFSTTDLSNMTGISQSTISKIENGKRRIDLESLEKIADALDVSVDRLTGESASSIIEDRLEEIGITLEELAEKTNVSLYWLKNLDSFIPFNEEDEYGYKWITRVAKAIGLPGSQLRAALARQEPPVYGGSNDVTPEETFNEFVKESLQSYLFELDTEYLCRIPLVGRIAAGDPILAIENTDEHIIIDTRINRINGNDINEYFALEVTGQSMEPTIHDGEVVLVRRQPEIEIGQIGVFLCDKEEATIKRFTREGGTIYLIPDNKQFPVKEYTEDCICLGKVIESIRRNIK